MQVVESGPQTGEARMYDTSRPEVVHKRQRDLHRFGGCVGMRLDRRGNDADEALDQPDDVVHRLTRIVGVFVHRPGGRGQ